MTDDPPRSFDLTTEPWVPVLALDGAETELSLREVFHRAGKLRRIVGDLPTQEFALLRLLLAMLHDAVDGPREIEDWGELWEGGLPAARVADYLDTHRERFDLLHPSRPFFQVAELHTTKGGVSSLDKLVADVPNGTPFFSMRARGVERLSFAEAARWLVHAHAYDPSGIKSGVVGDPRQKGGKGYPLGVGWTGHLGGVYVEGDTLAETLLLNLVAPEEIELHAEMEDRPAWRFDPPGPGPLTGREQASRPYGVRDLYTWQGRRVRLHHDAEGVHGVLLSYGDPLPATEQPMQRREPLSGWRYSDPQSKKHKRTVYMPQEHRPDRSAWRGLEAIVVEQHQDGSQRDGPPPYLRPHVLRWLDVLCSAEHGHLDEDSLIRTRLVGAVYGTQQSVIDEVTDDRLRMPIALLHRRHAHLAWCAVDAVQDAERSVTALGQLAANLADAAGAEKTGPRDTARDRGFGTLDGPFRGWLVTLTSDSDAAERRADWQREVRRLLRGLGEELVAQAGETAWIGRTIETKTGSHWLNSASAERRFRRSLNQILTKAFDDTTEVVA